MSWILAVVFLNGEVLANDFKTETECVREMRLTIRAMEAEGEKIDKVSCTPGIVVSAIDEED
jgi:hypothetical protein